MVAYLRHSMMVWRAEARQQVTWGKGDFTYSLARAVPSDDEGERCVKDDGLAMVGTEGADARNVSFHSAAVSSVGNAPLDLQAFDFGHGGGLWTLAATHA